MRDTATQRPFFGRPMVWLAYAIGLLVVPAIGYMIEAGMAWEDIHPAMNAMLNATSGVFLGVGWAAIKRRRIALHRSCMIAAFTTSGLFLASYLTRYAMTGTHHYPGDGWDKAVYLAVLFSHMVLAAVLVPVAFRALYLGLKRRDARHRRIARVAWPMWMYVSVTGVIVYIMLYPLAGA